MSLADKKAESRRKDREDIESGRATPAEVNARNAWIPNPKDWVILNLTEATMALGHTKWEDDDDTARDKGESSTVDQER